MQCDYHRYTGLNISLFDEINETRLSPVEAAFDCVCYKENSHDSAGEISNQLAEFESPDSAASYATRLGKEHLSGRAIVDRHVTIVVEPQSLIIIIPVLYEADVNVPTTALLRYHEAQTPS
ncbi:hypothetical protein AAF712_015981 [Marasmius tenuissimus]|uniref:Uncharacterized protein n=1 Tax=Marasmius tenuissimus TaxID=585030 RepID=A0ABR2Z822_9AGAR